MTRLVGVLFVLALLSSAAGPRAAEFPEPIDHLARMKDLLAMPKPKSCDREKADLNTIQLQICSALAFRDAEAALNRAYQAAMKDGSAEQRGKLRLAERAWLAYRDAECAWESGRYEGGTLAGVAYGQCLVDLTLARVKAIQAAMEP